MRSIKKLVVLAVTAIVLIAALLISIAGCGSPSTTTATTSQAPQTTQASTTQASQTTQAPGKTYNLKLGWGMPAVVWQSKVISRFVDNVKTKTGGQVIITPYFDATLFPPKEQVNALKSGLADAGIFYTANNPGEFPVTDLVNLPFYFDNSQQALDSFVKMYNDGLMPEYTGKGFKTMGFADMGYNYILTKSTDIDSFSKLKGLKIRSLSKATSDTLIALGATPVTVSSADLYMSLDRGVIDGDVYGPGYWAAMRTYEVAHSLLNYPLCSQVVFTAMNQKTWDSLTPDLQKTMTECFKEFADDWNQTVQAEELGKSVQTLKDKGVVFQQISADEVASVKQATHSIIDNYKVTLDNLGLDGQKIMDTCNAIINQGK
jgi:TRAP-type transport system periplasmic protein